MHKRKALYCKIFLQCNAFLLILKAKTALDLFSLTNLLVVKKRSDNNIRVVYQKRNST